MEKLKIIDLTKDRYDEWEKFCLQSDDAWFMHTTDMLDYSIALRPQLKSQQCSFMVKKGEEIFAACPLIVESNEDGVRQFSFGGIPGYVPALRNDLSREKKEKILRFAFQHIDELASELKVLRGVFGFSPLAPLYLRGPRTYNYLTRYGYLDVSLATQVIDLSLDLKVLSGDLSKGQRRHARGSKESKVKIYTKDTTTREAFDAYHALHQKAAGRVTRPPETFEMMYQWIKKGNAFLATAENDGRVIACSLFADYKGNAMYSSACIDPAIRSPKLSAGHIIQWKVIEWLKDTQHNYYETGWQLFAPLLHNYPSQKEINISHFKRGFGGYTVPLFVGEKYYSRDYFKKVYSRRLKNYAATIKEA